MGAGFARALGTVALIAGVGLTAAGVVLFFLNLNNTINLSHRTSISLVVVGLALVFIVTPLLCLCSFCIASDKRGRRKRQDKKADDKTRVISNDRDTPVSVPPPVAATQPAPQQAAQWSAAPPQPPVAAPQAAGAPAQAVSYPTPDPDFYNRGYRLPTHTASPPAAPAATPPVPAPTGGTNESDTNFYDYPGWKHSWANYLGMNRGAQSSAPQAPDEGYSDNRV